MKTRPLQRCWAFWMAPDGPRYAGRLRDPEEAVQRAPSGALLVFDDARVVIMPPAELLPVIDSLLGKIVPEADAERTAGELADWQETALDALREGRPLAFKPR